MKARKYIHVDNTVSQDTFVSVQNAVAPSESLVASVAIDRFVNDGVEIVHVGSDVDVLFSEQKMKQINDYNLDLITQRLKQGTSGLFDGCSDDEIISSIKSRYIQSPADIERFMRSVEKSAHKIKETIDFRRSQQEWQQKYEEMKKSKTSDKSE